MEKECITSYSYKDTHAHTIVIVTLFSKEAGLKYPVFGDLFIIIYVFNFLTLPQKPEPEAAAADVAGAIENNGKALCYTYIIYTILHKIIYISHT